MPYETEKEKNGEYLVKAKDTGKEYHTKDPKKLEQLHEEFKHIKEDDPDGMTPDKDVNELEQQLTDSDKKDEVADSELDDLKKENEELRKSLKEFREREHGAKMDEILTKTDDNYSSLVKRLIANAEDPDKLFKELVKENNNIAKRTDNLENTHVENELNAEIQNDTKNTRADELQNAFNENKK